MNEYLKSKVTGKLRDEKVGLSWKEHISKCQSVITATQIWTKKQKYSVTCQLYCTKAEKKFFFNQIVFPI